MLLADLEWEDGSEVVASPRQILRKQLKRLADRGMQAFAGTELEFIVFKDTYEEAWKKAYRDLEPANLYNIDYSLLGSARVEPLIRRIRNEMGAAEMIVENSKGECNLGQHEINFHYGAGSRGLRRPRRLQDRRQGDRGAGGDGDHLHREVRRMPRATRATSTSRSLTRRASNAFAADQQLFDRFIAGQLACMRELSLLYAPNVNSYKRFAKGSFAPTAVAWGKDNRTCSLRVVGHGPGPARREPPAGCRRQPLSGAVGADRRGAARHRLGARARAGARGQRLRVRQAARPDQHLRGQGPVRRERGRQGGVRAGGGGPLPEPRPGRDRRQRGRRHRLGEVPRIRAAVSSMSRGHDGESRGGDLHSSGAGALDRLGGDGDDGSPLLCRRRPGRRGRSPYFCRPTSRWSPTPPPCSTASTA